jgi:hypothetical protein
MIKRQTNFSSLPENDRIRFTISPDSRKGILKRLLLLNHQVHKQELEQNPAPKTPSKKHYFSHRVHHNEDTEGKDGVKKPVPSVVKDKISLTPVNF